MVKTVIVFAGGDPPPPGLADLLPGERFVIAADSGFDHAHRLGVAVDLVVGDLDSISAEGLAAFSELGAGVIEQHPADKDATDLALALDAALHHVSGGGPTKTPEPGAPETEEPATRVIVIGGAGGRIDHFLANAALLAAPEYSTMDITWLPGRASVFVVRTRIELTGQPGDLVSLIPYGGPALGVSTTGLRWPLTRATLRSGTSVGVSNQLTGDRATVALTGGVLLCIQPGDEPTTEEPPDSSVVESH